MKRLMSEEFMGSNRKPTERERRLIEFLANKASLDWSAKWSEQLRVQSMNDGDMGSLLLIPNNVSSGKRQFGQQVAEYRFKDSDGVDVIASLNVDSDGNLFELDIWKTNFERLLEFPNLRVIDDEN